MTNCIKKAKSSTEEGESELKKMDGCFEINSDEPLILIYPELSKKQSHTIPTIPLAQQIASVLQEK
jgi:hypothetical protein